MYSEPYNVHICKLRWLRTLMVGLEEQRLTTVFYRIDVLADGYGWDRHTVIRAR